MIRHCLAKRPEAGPTQAELMELTTTGSAPVRSVTAGRNDVVLAGEAGPVHRLLPEPVPADLAGERPVTAPRPAAVGARRRVQRDDQHRGGGGCSRRGFQEVPAILTRQATVPPPPLTAGWAATAAAPTPPPVPARPTRPEPSPPPPALAALAALAGGGPEAVAPAPGRRALTARAGYPGRGGPGHHPGNGDVVASRAVGAARRRRGRRAARARRARASPSTRCRRTASSAIPAAARRTPARSGTRWPVPGLDPAARARRVLVGLQRDRLRVPAVAAAVSPARARRPPSTSPGAWPSHRPGRVAARRSRSG